MKAGSLPQGDSGFRSQGIKNFPCKVPVVVPSCSWPIACPFGVMKGQLPFLTLSGLMSEAAVMLGHAE